MSPPFDQRSVKRKSNRILIPEVIQSGKPLLSERLLDPPASDGSFVPPRWLRRVGRPRHTNPGGRHNVTPRQTGYAPLVLSSYGSSPRRSLLGSVASTSGQATGSLAVTRKTISPDHCGELDRDP